MDNLPDFYIQKAKIELNETETRKKQSLEQFNEWLSKHPFVKKHEIDPSIIVRLFRSRKYNMDKVYENINKCIIFQKNHQELFNFNITKLLEIYDKGVILPMKIRNADGQRIIIVRNKIFDDLKSSNYDIMRMVFTVGDTISYEQETQICGVVVVMDLREISVRYIANMDVNFFANCIRYIESAGARLKQINIIGLPSIANTFLEILKTMLSQKLISRMHFFKNVQDLTKVMDVKNLPVEYGGSEDADDCLKCYREKYKESASKYAKFIESLEIDEKRMRNYEAKEMFKGVGSFRKLEID
ncbi:clavesin-1-like [Chironomus tepperi]|uniref:clavesin-1-like n=1 Tax=Chironomus tepperi TaxID=113505 RepID=UPI00391F7EB3